MERIEFGKYVVADPKICHGKLTFKGTRIFVQDVLEMVAEGIEWDEIIYRWHNSITEAAIAEAIYLASQVFIEHVGRLQKEVSA